MTTAKNMIPRARSGSRLKILLLYAAVLALLWGLWALMMRVVYPTHLMFTAPDLPALLPPALRALFPETDLGVASGAAMRFAIYENRDSVWRLCLTVMQGAGVAVMLLMQGVWKMHVRRRCIPLARQGRRAAASYRVMLLFLVLAQGMLAALTWFMGVNAITGRTVWDLLCAFAMYPACVLGGVLLCRLGAPSCVSARHGFFLRL